MVMDFGFLKEAMVKVIHDPCDHAMIWYEEDPMYVAIFDPHDMPDAYVEGVNQAVKGIKQVNKFDGWKNYVIDRVPTAENLAYIWYLRLSGELRLIAGVKLAEVKVWETPNCYASYPVVPNVPLHSHLANATIGGEPDKAGFDGRWDTP